MDLPRIYLSPPDVGPVERELLLDAFDSGWIAPLGPHVDAFERELAAATGVEHAAALSSGTAALHLGLLILGVGPGDRVVTSTLTFAATVNAIRYVGAEPVLLDVDPESWTLDPGLLEAELEESAARGVLPKAVIPVDLYGVCCDYDRIRAACERHGVPILQDAAEALGAQHRGRPAGSQGDLAVVSFNGNKIATTSGGGALLSDRADWIERARYLSTQAREPVAHYEHRAVGFNYRMSNLLAAIGRGQLRRLPELVAACRANRDFYASALRGWPGVAVLTEPDYAVSNAWLSCVTVDPARLGANREAIRLHLETQQIEARPVWKPMHLQPVFADCPRRGGEVAERLFETGLCLPSGSSLTTADRARVLTALESAPGIRVPN